MLPFLKPLPMKNWRCNCNVIKVLVGWELLNNPAFKPVAFDGFKKQAGLNGFTLMPSATGEEG